MSLDHRDVVGAAKEDNPVVLEIRRHLQDWWYLANILRSIHIALGVIAVTCALIVAAQINSANKVLLEWLALAGAIAVALQTSFRLGDKANRFRRAWRLLNESYMLYKTGIHGMDQVIKAYGDGEDIVGDVEPIVR